jgi:hypothetical protein
MSWIRIIENDNPIHNIVLRLKGDSSNQNQVMRGNIRYDVPNARRRTDHALSYRL